MIETDTIKKIKVLIGQINLTRAPNVLEAILGSCIGLVIYDKQTKLGGLAHVLLPDSQGHTQSNLPGKFADRAVINLFNALKQHGANPSRLEAKMAGGAHMFSKLSLDWHNDVGKANVDAVRNALKSLSIPLVAMDIGGNSGRKIEFDLVSFILNVADFSSQRHSI
jgi:chemotaxis protein CheD